ncbi:hypothetical protein LSI54_08085 [Nesterenkonia sp. AY15]|uniref:hypothetical protein n=1 Tax=Nesterenkonia sp. AY15 TaxID=2901139 RepID=UPI001F4C8838|nr:hypothetical protein [Nesterenkonia sp. AY15]MCH8571313.1 hypothetical protein [Nesterenkonia sp. AY15]
MTTDSAMGRSGVARDQPESAVSGDQLSPEEVVVALLRQQETLLAELSWAYEQLERSQESEIAALRSRVSSLEYRVAKKLKGRSIPQNDTGRPASSFLTDTRKRVDFTIRHPRRAIRAAERRLRGRNEAPAAQEGLTK